MNKQSKQMDRSIKGSVPFVLTLKPSTSSLAALVAANLLPLSGVILWGWQVGDVVFLYWAENLVIGAFCVLRMLTSAVEFEGDPIQVLVGRLGLYAFFIVHYGGFCYIHGSFLGYLFPPPGLSPDYDPYYMLGELLRDSHAVLAMLAIVASHGYSFVVHHFVRGERHHTSTGDLMTRPYRRIAITHAFVFGGAFLVTGIDSPMPAIALFVVLKTAFDAHAHVKEHRPQPQPDETNI